MNFNDVVGHEDIVNFIKTSVKLDKVAHAYILSGPKGLGKKMLTQLFSKTVLCEEPIITNNDLTFCGECRCCLQMNNFNNPDYKVIVQEKENVIGIDEIRIQINNDVIIKPYSSKKKIYVIDHADKMTEQAQNVLLKTLEEPPHYAIVFLLVENDKVLLPTIQSRCVSLKLKSIKDSEIINYLIMNENIQEYDASICAKFAQGNLGQAKELIHSEAFMELRNNVINTLQSLQHFNVIDFNQMIEKLIGSNKDKKNKVNKNTVYEILELLNIFWRDVLVYKVTDKTSKLIYQENISLIKEYSKVLNFSKLDELLLETGKTRKAITAKVSEDVAIELLLYKIKESLND